jgi:hypothetical protein
MSAATVEQEYHLDYMRNRREDPEFLYHEARLKFINRIKNGTTPTTKAMAKYNFTIEDVNQWRKINGLPAIVMNSPMFLKSTLYRGVGGGVGEADAIPPMSEVEGEYNPIDEKSSQEVDQDIGRLRAGETLEEQQLRVESSFLAGKFDADTIAKYMRSNPRQATTKRPGALSEKTLTKYYGKVGSTGDTGDFKRFLMYLDGGKKGKFYRDLREVLKRENENHIRERINAPRKNKRVTVDRLTGEPNEYKDLKSTNDEFGVIISTIRTYPAFAKDYEEQTRSFMLGYNRLDRIFIETDAKVQAEKNQKPKPKFALPEWKEVFKLWMQRYPKEQYPKEFLYMLMYNENPGRDDFKRLFVDDTDGELPDTRQKVEAVTKNTLFIPNENSRKRKRKADYVLADYKTKSLYDTQAYEFSETVTKEIVEYVKKKRITGPRSDRYLFGASAMSGWVGKRLDDIPGIPEQREGNINFLRKSFISTELKKCKTPAEREQLAITFRHSPNASLKYVRELHEAHDAEKMDKGILEKIRKDKAFPGLDKV